MVWKAKMLLAEVQQSSDVTYRIYDYDNTEPDGTPRKLQFGKSIGCYLLSAQRTGNEYS